MNALPEWDLTDLYASKESLDFKKEISQLELKVIHFCKNYKGKLSKISSKKIEEVIVEYEGIEEILNKIKSFCYLLYCTQQTNDEISVFYQKTTEDLVRIESKILFFGLELNKISQAIINSMKNSKYFPWIENYRKFKKFQKNERVEKILLDKNLTSCSSWIRLFDETMARIKFDYKGKKISESKILNYLSSSKKDERKNAAIGFGKGLKDNIHLFSLITNTLSKDLDIDNKIRGFKYSESFRHLSNQVSKEDVDCLAETVVNNYEALAHRYYRYKSKVFGVNKLDYWDRNAPYPNQKKINFSWSEARKLVLKSYSKFDKRISDIVELFFKNNWIHASIVNGKTSGAFAHPTVPSVHPYILLNYQNNHRDVMTLAHELGHGVHQYLANSQGCLLSDTPLTLAETASVFGEMLTFKYMYEQASSSQLKRTILRSKIEDMLNTVVRQISFFRFEKEVHNKRISGELSVDDINNIWISTQSESLGNSIRLNGNYKYFWAYIPHFIHSPYYVYAYAFGDCLVNSLYSKYEEGFDNFNDKYITLLCSGGSKNYKSLLSEFDLNPNQKNFWQGGLNLVKNMITQLESLD